MKIAPAIAASLALMATASSAEEKAAPVDPLTAEIDLADADRFVALFERTDGAPSAEDIRQHYLQPGSDGITVFTPGRIESAERLAAVISADPQSYRKAIDECLPVARASNADLRSIYLGLKGAFPGIHLPRIYILFGAGNSGGTAGNGAQVLGLEVLCSIVEDPDDLRKTLRHFFAHETVHVLQEDAGFTAEDDVLLRNVLAEGAADFIARLVTGEEPDVARAQWALPREVELMEILLADIDLVRQGSHDADAAMHRWVHNYSSAPNGWPGELGYWMGMRIWERYWARAEDKQAALETMLAIENPRGILEIAMREPAIR